MMDFKTVGTLGNDLNDPTCSILATKSLNKSFTIRVFQTFERIVDSLLAKDVDAMIVPAAYPYISIFIMHHCLVVYDIFMYVIPPLVFGSKSPVVKIEYEKLFNHSATNSLTSDINAKWGEQINVNSNSEACLALQNNDCCLTNSACA